MKKNVKKLFIQNEIGVCTIILYIMQTIYIYNYIYINTNSSTQIPRFQKMLLRKLVDRRKTCMKSYTKL